MRRSPREYPFNTRFMSQQRTLSLTHFTYQPINLTNHSEDPFLFIVCS